jgi:putative SOS response-associated peptidase YedK
MCGRYTLTASNRPELSGFATTLVDRFNIAPQSEVLVRDESLELTLMRWDLSPPWAKSPMHLFNARAETLAEKPSFRGTKRCIFIADGWYEWQKVGAQKQPWYHHQDGELLHFAGVYHPQGGCAIVTQAAHPAIEHIHHRQPLLLEATSLEAWVDGAPPSAMDKDIEVQAHRVSQQVSNARLDNPTLNQPIKDIQGHPQEDFWS